MIETFEANHLVPVFDRHYLVPNLVRNFEVELVFASAYFASLSIADSQKRFDAHDPVLPVLAI